MTFVTRKMKVQFRLGTGSFGESGENTVELDGYRMAATITRGGGISYNQARLTIWGMKLDLMNELVTIGTVISRPRRNSVTIYAGDDDKGMAVVFMGDILNAWADLSGMPDTALVVTAMTGVLNAARPIQPTSINGAADVATLMSGFAKQGGYDFENNDVQVTLSNPYFDGFLQSQIEACAEAAHINFNIDDNVLAIWPKTGHRGGVIPLVSKDTGMVGYPTFTQLGLAIETLFNPSIRFNGLIKVESSITPATGQWIPYMISHDLAAEMPDGPWFTRMECVPDGQPIPV